jgi:hypothetical protein
VSYGLTIAGRLHATQVLLDTGIASYRDCALLLGMTPEQAESVPDACKWEPPAEDEDE